LYKARKKQHASRWSGSRRNLDPADNVELNAEKRKNATTTLKDTAIVNTA